MHFPRYWTSVKKGEVSAWGWSDNSVAEAEGKAQERLAKVLDRLARGGTSPVHRYGYPDRPMREEVLREFRAADGTVHAAVTRNSYGCLVLNTTNLMFVDVDGQGPQPTGFLAKLFGFGKQQKGPAPDEFANGVMARVRDWVARKPDWGWRVYRTHSGIRLLATHQGIMTGDVACKEAFEVFGADPLYRQLCASQKCFRARLTPKPWRCGVGKQNSRWPWGNAEWEAKFRRWETKYLAAAGNHATCRLIGSVGNPEISPAHAEVVAFHDELTRVKSELPLA